MEDFKSTYPLIHNKVTSPRYVTPLLRRPRLLDWLNANAEARAIVIAAGAGYGKTTLLWQWEREVDFPCYWYKLDRNDRDWTLHISYLVEAISQHYPGFGRRAHSVLRQMGGPGSSRPGVAAFLLAEMQEKLRQPCTFIIDDWQYVASVTEVRGLWNQILRDSPPTCRFVFASRGKPQLQFARFKTHGGYAELRTDDLRVTGSELAELFRDVYHNPLTPEEAADLERRTEGWAAGLQLVEVSLRERRTPEERRALIDSLTARTDSDLFSFLAEEVLDQQTEETRNFLLSTSILQQITPEVAERLAGVHDGMRHLLQLEHAGLFTNRLDETRYRYHGLFREFLERRLADERSEAEVMGLHIHAASYFETSSQWPEAIYHYLRAGLQRQAARLIARYGEDVVSEGRLGMVDEWLQQLPTKTIHDNARLSLLHGEALGIRGEWSDAIGALERARAFFERKQDRRMEAVAYIKQSSVYHHWGSPRQAADSARAGLSLTSPDDRGLRLRLEGNLAITGRSLDEPLSKVKDSVARIAVEARQLGLEHYAAIGMHNLGHIQLEMGEVRSAIASLEEARAFWEDLPANPFCDNYSLVRAYLAAADSRRAMVCALTGEQRTRSWAFSHAEALMGVALAKAFSGQVDEALSRLGEVLAHRDLGVASTEARIHYVEIAVDYDRINDDLLAVIRDLEDPNQDPRFDLTREAAVAIVRHLTGACDSECCDRVWTLVGRSEERGAHLTSLTALALIAPALLAHNPTGQVTADITAALLRGDAIGVLPSMRARLRRLAPHLSMLARDRGVDLASSLIRAEPSFWIPVVIETGLADVSALDRERLLRCIERHAQPDTAELLAKLRMPEADAIRLRLIHQRAPRLYVRTFGRIAVHRGSWNGPLIPIHKRRTRALLSLLASRAEAVSRDSVLDLLWPDAEPAAAVNSLNQTLFQLRRAIDPTYRDGQSAQYIVSSVDHVQLEPLLVRLDWVEALRRAESVALGSGATSEAIAFLVGSIRGTFLEDSLYDDWSAQPRRQIHESLRDRLLPVATHAQKPAVLRAQIARLLVLLDPFDEGAHIALAKALAETGRRAAAIATLDDLERRLQQEFDEPPTPDLLSARSTVRKSSPIRSGEAASNNPLDSGPDTN